MFNEMGIAESIQEQSISLLKSPYQTSEIKKHSTPTHLIYSYEEKCDFNFPPLLMNISQPGHWALLQGAYRILRAMDIIPLKEIYCKKQILCSKKNYIFECQKIDILC
jgi:hypothetical protein